MSAKNANISILRNFFQFFFSISINFIKYYLYAEFQINWTIQTEITEGAESVLAQPYQSAKSSSGLTKIPFLKRLISTSR